MKPAEKVDGGRGVAAIQGVVDPHRPGGAVQLGHESKVLLYSLSQKIKLGIGNEIYIFLELLKTQCFVYNLKVLSLLIPAGVH